MVSGGLHGVGVSVVYALSEWVEVTVRRQSKLHRQRFERGAPIGSLTSEDQPFDEGGRTGTSVRFKPDIEIFTGGIVFDYATLSARSRELAYLNGGVRIVFRDERESARDAEGNAHEEIYFYEGGIKEYVAYMNAEKDASRDHLPERRKGWCFGGSGTAVVRGCLLRQHPWFCQQHPHRRWRHPHRGSEDRAAARSTPLPASAASARILIPTSLAKTSARVTAVLSVKVQNLFEGQTKTKLGNTEVRGIVDSLVGEALSQYLEFNPGVIDMILEKAIRASMRRKPPAVPASWFATRAFWKVQRCLASWRTAAPAIPPNRDLHRGGDSAGGPPSRAVIGASRRFFPAGQNSQH